MEGLNEFGSLLPGEATRMVQQAVNEVSRSQGGTVYPVSTEMDAQLKAGPSGRAPEGDCGGERDDLYPTMFENMPRNWRPEDGAESGGCLPGNYW